jgi:hypothetical protein
MLHNPPTLPARLARFGWTLHGLELHGNGDVAEFGSIEGVEEWLSKQEEREGKTRMTDQQYTWIQQLARCRFAPASWDKRFIRDAQEWPKEKELSERQATALENLAYRYRRQRGDVTMQRPAGARPDTSDRDAEMLKGWNEGRPL